MLSTRSVDLRALNSATKYPSIPTYHSLGDRGSLLEEVVSFAGCEVIATEKVDGTNSRIILMPDGCFLIGSREELLHSGGDLIHNPAQGIVEAVRETAARLAQDFQPPDGQITTVYLETYGGKTTAAAKQYTGSRAVGFRLFDVCRVPATQLASEPAKIAAWREAGGQAYLQESELAAFAEGRQLQLTPRIVTSDPLPTSITDTHAWLGSMIQSTHVALDDGAGGQPEGLVIRTADRQRIAKLRFEDYQRHQRRAAKS